jgi:hypothetical protein
MNSILASWQNWRSWEENGQDGHITGQYHNSQSASIPAKLFRKKEQYERSNAVLCAESDPWTRRRPLRV